MSPKIWRDFLILIAIFGAIWAALSYYSYEVEVDPFDFSLESEADLADLVDDFIEADAVFVENAALDSSLLIIFDRLTSHMDPVTYEYELHVIRDEQVNAFTSLNGNIYVFTGLIETLESAEELAVILAHEIGHAEEKHVVEKLAMSLGMETLFSIMSGGDPVLASELTKMVVSTSFDRHNEEEADDFALELALKSGINPRRLGQFFLRLKSNESSFLDEIEFIRTHPLDNDRIKRSSDIELPEGFEEDTIPVNWEALQKMAWVQD